MTQPASINNLSHGSSRPDSRAGLGYGQITNKNHAPRQTASSYPYKEEDEHEDADISDIPIEIQAKIRKVVNGYMMSDPLDIKGTDPFYYTAGNTKLGEAVGTSISPMPAMYKKRMQAGGGVNKPKAYSQGSLQQTGSTIGYSHPHKSMGADKELLLHDLEDEEMLPMQKVKAVIQSILQDE